MPRAITATVSKYQRSRIWRGDFLRGESFQLGINLNGVLPTGTTIAEITWRVWNPACVILGAATLDERSASVTCTTGFGPGSFVKAIVTDSDGRIWTQMFTLYVIDGPWFQGETVPAQGPYSVEEQAA